MKKALLALALLAAVMLAMPERADAHFSLSLGLPGFGLFISEPGPSPVAYYPPPAYYAPPVYYRPYYRPFYGSYHRAYYGRPGCHRYGGYRRWR